MTSSSKPSTLQIVAASAAPDWPGLPIYIHAPLQPVDRVDDDVPAPMLALWKTGDTDVELRRADGKHWRFRGRANRFDLCAPGRYRRIWTRSGRFRQAILPLPDSFLRQHFTQTPAELGLTECRIQFTDNRLQRLVRGLLMHARGGRHLGALYSQSLSIAIVERLAQMAGGAPVHGSDPLEPRTCRMLQDMIEADPGCDLRLHDLALVSGRRTADFLPAFRFAFGRTPHQYLLDRRVEHAKRLIGGDMPLAQVATQLGFASHAHFTAIFKSRTGQLPGGYRA